MAISWGSWEYSGGNGMRVGLDVSWENITHGEAAATCTIEIWTENQYSYSDDQKLSYGGAIGGSTSFHNGAGGAAVKRATKTYTYNYGSNEYGSSPGSRTFSASLSGAFNGVTPSKSVSSKIPARPYDDPAAPTNVSVARVSDTSQKVTWTNKSTAGEPWHDVNVDRDALVDGTWHNLADLGGSATSVTDSNTFTNAVYKYRVRAENSVGVSAFVETAGAIYTTPATPTNVTQSPGTGAEQVVSWTNNVGYDSYNTEVWVSRNGVWSLLATVGSGVTTYTDTAASAAEETKYKVRAKTTAGVQGTLYSADSVDTSGTTGSTSPPSAPSNLAPNNASIDRTVSQNFTWTHNPTDGSAQSAYEVRVRVAGSSTWTSLGQTTSATASHTFAANYFSADTDYEWQVRTWGADPTESVWADSAVFTTAVYIPGELRALALDTQNGEVHALPPNPYCRMGRTNNTGTANNNLTLQLIGLTHVFEETVAGMADVANNQIVIPEDGLYLVSAYLTHASNASGTRRVVTSLGGVMITQSEMAGANVGSDGQTVGATALWRLTSGTTLQMFQGQNSGAALDIYGDGTAGRHTYLEVLKVRD